MRLFALSCCLLVASEALAEDYGAKARTERTPMAATHDADPSASGTTLELTDRVTVPRSLADVVREAPGARVQSTGALGAFSSVSLRGGDGDEVTVMIDEIPLTTADGGPFDLGLFAAELFGRLHVFRGGSPVWLGSGAIGGVLQLVPRRDMGRTSDLSLGAGSFGEWRAQGGAGAAKPGLALNTRLIVRGAKNDYPYDDDRGTSFDASDDIELRRKNAEVQDAAAYLDVSRDLGPGNLHVLVLAHEKMGGFPGPGSQPTPNIHAQAARALAGVSYSLRPSGLRRRLALTAATSYNLNRYSDTYGELGTSGRWETNDQAYRTFLRAATTLRFARWLESTVVASYALDRYAWQNAFAFIDPAPSTRHTAAGALEFLLRHRLGPVQVEMRPSARLEWSRTELHANRGQTGLFDATRDVLAPTARLGVAVAPHPGIALSGSVATGTRVATNYELFGDRAQVLPAPTLNPVTSLTYDGGISLKGARGLWLGSTELRGFWQERDDAIVARRTAQWQVVHENQPSVRQRGFEFGAQGRVTEYARLAVSATFLDTEGEHGKRLPFRARWVSYARPEAMLPMSGARRAVFRAAAELWQRSFVYADLPNLAYVPRCFTTSVSASVSLWGDLLEFSGRADDVADARCADLVGYPLPGRTLFFAIRVRESEHG